MTTVASAAQLAEQRTTALHGDAQKMAQPAVMHAIALPEPSITCDMPARIPMPTLESMEAEMEDNIADIQVSNARESRPLPDGRYRRNQEEEKLAEAWEIAQDQMFPTPPIFIYCGRIHQPLIDTQTGSRQDWPQDVVDRSYDLLEHGDFAPSTEQHFRLE